MYRIIGSFFGSASPGISTDGNGTSNIRIGIAFDVRPCEYYHIHHVHQLFNSPHINTHCGPVDKGLFLFPTVGNTRNQGRVNTVFVISVQNKIGTPCTSFCTFLELVETIDCPMVVLASLLDREICVIPQRVKNGITQFQFYRMVLLCV